MAQPSGLGSEVAKFATGTAANNTVTMLTTVADDIYIIKNIIVCNRDSGTAKIAFTVNDGSNDRYILIDQTIAIDSTFVWSDILFINGAGNIKIIESGGQAIDYMINYIHQDWSA